VTALDYIALELPTVRRSQGPGGGRRAAHLVIWRIIRLRRPQPARLLHPLLHEPRRRLGRPDSVRGERAQSASGPVGACPAAAMPRRTDLRVRPADGGSGCEAGRARLLPGTRLERAWTFPGRDDLSADL